MRIFLMVLALAGSTTFAQSIDLNIPTPRDFPTNWPSASAKTTAQKDIALISAAPAVHQYVQLKGDTVVDVSVLNDGRSGVYLVSTSRGCSVEVWSLENRKYSIRRSTWSCNK